MRLWAHSYGKGTTQMKKFFTSCVLALFRSENWKVLAFDSWLYPQLRFVSNIEAISTRIMSCVSNLQIKSAHPVLCQATQKLAYQVQLVEWCLQYAGSVDRLCLARMGMAFDPKHSLTCESISLPSQNSKHSLNSSPIPKHSLDGECTSSRTHSRTQWPIWWPAKTLTHACTHALTQLLTQSLTH